MSAEATSPESQSVPAAAPADLMTPPVQAEASAANEAALSLTDIAADKVREIRSQENIEPNYALRVKVMGGGCSGFQYDLYFDEKAEGDYEFESNGVLLVAD